jgi:hypothetical protein
MLRQLKSKFNIHPLFRAVGVAGSVSVLATGVTFAAFGSTATITDTTVASVSVKMQVATREVGSEDPLNFSSSSSAGLAGTGLEVISEGGSAPGTAGDATNSKNVYFKNLGSQALKLSAKSLSPLATLSSYPEGGQLEASDVHFLFTKLDGFGTGAVDSFSATLEDINSGTAANALGTVPTLAGGTDGEDNVIGYNVRMYVMSSEISGDVGQVTVGKLFDTDGNLVSSLDGVVAAPLNVAFKGVL